MQIIKNRVTPYVSENVLDVVFDTLVDGRRYFGSAGASLTHQISSPDWRGKGINAKLAKIGIEGERRTSVAIREWMEDKPDVVLLDSVHIRDANGVEVETTNTDGEGFEIEEGVVDSDTGVVDQPDTDHVIVIGNTVVLVDSKVWRGGASPEAPRIYSVTKNKTVVRGSSSFRGGNVRMRQAMYMWADYLKANVAGIVAVSGENIKIFRNNFWYAAGYRIVRLDELVEQLDDIYGRIDEKGFVNASIVSQVAISCVKPYDLRRRMLKDSENKSVFRG